jgi:hypothetical protein
MGKQRTFMIRAEVTTKDFLFIDVLKEMHLGLVIVKLMAMWTRPYIRSS